MTRVLTADDMAIVTATRLLTGKAGYRQFGFVELLTPDGYNPKTKKGRARGYSTAIMHFAPAKPDGTGVLVLAHTVVPVDDA